MQKSKTIDDIFKKFANFRSRGSIVRTKSPVIRDITEQVLDEKSFFTADPEIPKNTTYLGFFSPRFPDARYFIGSSKTSFYNWKKTESSMQRKREMRLEVFDKISQRKLCDMLGIFENPRYMDVRKLFSDTYATTIFRFIPSQFKDFPLDDIVSGLSKEPSSYIFHNVVDGFRIRSTSKKALTITGRSDIVKEANTETRGITDPRARIQAFLRKLVQKRYSLDVIGFKGNTNGGDRLIEAILSHQGNLYIKDARTGGGYLVVRVRKEALQTCIESDSAEFMQLIKEREGKRQSLMERYQTYVDLNAPQVMLNEVSARINRYDAKNNRGILHDLFLTLENPLVEEEVPCETINGERAELRLICQRLSCLPSKKFGVIGYAKVSGKYISANISLGGHGDKISNVLNGIYSQRLSWAKKDQLATIITEAEKDIIERTTAFAEGVYNYYKSNRTMKRQGIDLPRDFAVDLIPTWDGVAREIKLYFLEINRLYAYKGLQEVDPAAARTVEMNQKAIQRDIFMRRLMGVLTGKT
ncbi:MAG: hypothetical protein ABIF10_05560 [Candidatus Woesearchaeota archaeon]